MEQVISVRSTLIWLSLTPRQLSSSCPLYISLTSTRYLSPHDCLHIHKHTLRLSRLLQEVLSKIGVEIAVEHAYYVRICVRWPPLPRVLGRMLRVWLHNTVFVSLFCVHAAFDDPSKGWKLVPDLHPWIRQGWQQAESEDNPSSLSSRLLLENETSWWSAHWDYRSPLTR